MSFWYSPAFYLFLIGCILFFKGKFGFRGSKGFISLVYMGVLYVFSTPFLLQTLEGNMEKSYPPFQVSSLHLEGDSQQVNIYILGAGHVSNTSYFPNQVLSLQAKSRVLEAIRVFRQLPNARIITSGSCARGGVSQSLCTRDALLSLGLDSSRLFLNEEPDDTESEAKYYVEMFGSETPLILVTNALHQKRAHAWFKQAGVKTIYHAPSDYEVYQGSAWTWKDFIPGIDQLLKWNVFSKEQLGWIEVRLKS